MSHKNMVIWLDLASIKKKSWLSIGSKTSTRSTNTATWSNGSPLRDSVTTTSETAVGRELDAVKPQHEWYVLEKNDLTHAKRRVFELINETNFDGS